MKIKYTVPEERGFFAELMVGKKFEGFEEGVGEVKSVIISPIHFSRSPLQVFPCEEAPDMINISVPVEVNINGNIIRRGTAYMRFRLEDMTAEGQMRHLGTRAKTITVVFDDFPV